MVVWGGAVGDVDVPGVCVCVCMCVRPRGARVVLMYDRMGWCSCPYVAAVDFLLSFLFSLKYVLLTCIPFFYLSLP